MLVSVHFDSAEAEASHRLLQHLADAPRIAPAMHHRETNESITPCSDKPGQFAIGDDVVGMERGENNRVCDASFARAAQVGFERRVGVPRQSKHRRVRHGNGNR